MFKLVLSKAVFGSLLLLSFSTTNTFVRAEGPPCNSVIGIVRLQEIQFLANTFNNILFQGSLNSTEEIAALAAQLGPAQYHVMASKVCGSCDEIRSMLNATTDTNDWESYCGADVYGADAMHSALVFHPLDPETLKPLGGIRNVHMAFISTRVDQPESFSTHFPSNVTQRIIEHFQITDPFLFFWEFSTSFSDSFPLMVAASAGLISIGPDGIGNGASAETHDRSYATDMPNRQAAVVSYYAAAEFTKAATNGCTGMGNHLITSGFSMGGNAVVFGTLALQSGIPDVTVVREFSHAGPYHVASIVQGFVAPVALNPVNGTADPTGVTIHIWAFLAAVYSNEFPYLVNSGTGQRLLSDEWYASNDTATDVRGWIFDDPPLRGEEIMPIYPKTGQAFLQSINQDMLGPILNATLDASLWCLEPYVTPEVAALCAALTLNSPVAVWDQVAASGVPFEYCHSKEDTVVPYAITEMFLLSFGLPNVFPYEPLYPFLEPRSDHPFAQLLCNMAIPTFFTRDSMMLEVQPLDCPAEPTMMPAQMPTASPEKEPTISPTDEPSWAACRNFMGTTTLWTVTAMVGWMVLMG